MLIQRITEAFSLRRGNKITQAMEMKIRLAVNSASCVMM